ncbi:MAG TPA: ATP-binding protein [Polyangiaceae bacterium]|nr:ATP-binding protein [Polyangiaceae bacterium]
MRPDGSPSALDKLLEDPSALGREELENHALALWSLLRIADAVQRAESYSELVERAVDAIAKYTHFPSVALFRLDRAEGILHLLATRGFNAEAVEKARRLPVEGSLTGVAVKQRAIVSSHDLSHDRRVEPSVRKALENDGFLEAASVPLFEGNEVIGALNLIYRHGSGLTESEHQVLTVLGQMIGLAMSARLAAEERERLEGQARRSQQIESLGIFAGGIAHDFNNILTGILGNISLVRMELPAAVAPGADGLLEDAELACHRAAGLVKQLLTFSRGGAPLRRPTRDLSKLVKEAASFATTGSSVALDFRAEPIRGVLEIDPGQIMQVIHNLVLNAVEASPPGATVTVSVAPKPARSGGAPTRAEIVVEDRGSGISAEDLPRIFEPYFTTRSRGSGLGLATTQSIVQRHDGHIVVDSVAGRGTRFIVELPLSRSETTAAPFPQAARAGSLAGVRVLVLEDEPLVSKLLARLLGALGIDAHLTARGEETIAAFVEAKGLGRPFDVVILDLTVAGGLGGRETLERLRALDSRVRALASSGYSEDDVLSRPREFGFDAILPKPYTQQAVIEALTAALANDGRLRDPQR